MLVTAAVAKAGHPGSLRARTVECQLHLFPQADTAERKPVQHVNNTAPSQITGGRKKHFQLLSNANSVNGINQIKSNR